VDAAVRQLEDEAELDECNLVMIGRHASACVFNERAVSEGEKHARQHNRKA
jgi:hypothetical protein